MSGLVLREDQVVVREQEDHAKARSLAAGKARRAQHEAARLAAEVQRLGG